MGANSALTDRDDTIIFFDGVCNLCSGAVMFVLKRDRNHRFKFASLQSDFARKYLSEFGFHAASLETIVLIQKGKIFKKSDAALQIARQLHFPWPFFYGLKVFPKMIRDFFYDIIARKRYQWFGKSDQCMLPTPEISKRFVD